MVRELLGQETPCIMKGIPVYGNKKRALHDCNALFYVYVCNADSALLQLAGNEVLHLLAAQVALHNGAVGTEEHDLWNATDAVEFGGVVLVVAGNVNLGIFDTLFLQSGLELILLIPYVHAQNDEILACELLVQLYEVGDFHLAGTAP